MKIGGDGLITNLRGQMPATLDLRHLHIQHQGACLILIQVDVAFLFAEFY
jgi:hypothetical protein